MIKSYKFRGGLRSGDSYIFSNNFTWPFAIIEISKEFIAISAPGVKLLFGANAIHAIKERDGLFSKGIQIEHQDKSNPSYVVFWTFRRKLMIDCFKRLGYRVAE